MRKGTTRGTSPYYRFKAPFELTTATEISLTIVQNNEVIVEKTKEDMVIDGKKFYIHLTAEETKRFSTIGDIEMQCVPEFPPGDDGIPSILASQTIRVPVKQMLKLLREVNDD